MFITGVHHVSIEVADFERSQEFYEQVLGLAPLDERPDFPFRGAWYLLGDTQLHLMEGPVTAGEKMSRVRHTAITVNDLAGFRKHLESHDVPCRDTIPIPGIGRFFFMDPDGNHFEATDAEKI